jgi:hypothetical protein
MTFQKDGYQIFADGLTADAFAFLSSLSHQHEATARATNGPWGERARIEEPTMASIEVFTEPVKRAILANTDCGWSELCVSISYPQLTYSFQTGQSQLALLQHVDGAGEETEEAIEHEILVGALLSSVASEADGPFVVWPGSHLSGRDFLWRNRQMPVWNAIRAIPLDPSRPQPFLGQAGDVILVHRLLQHGTAARSAPGVRRMAFVRLGLAWPPHAANTPVEKTGFAR